MATPSKSKKQDTRPPYSDLPSEVMAVADRIGLGEGSGVTAVVQALGKDSYDNIKHHAYHVKHAMTNITKYSKNQKKRKDLVKNEKKKRKDRLTSKERRELFDVTKSKNLRYCVLIGLNDLWRGYIQSVISSIKSPVDQLKLIRADFHGALFVVSAAKNPALIGLKGIVIQETKNTFRLITQEDRVVTVSKVGSIFTFLSQGRLYKLNGSHLAMSPHQRARTKPKVRAQIDLKSDV